MNRSPGYLSQVRMAIRMQWKQFLISFLGRRYKDDEYCQAGTSYLARTGILMVFPRTPSRATQIIRTLYTWETWKPKQGLTE